MGLRVAQSESGAWRARRIRLFGLMRDGQHLIHPGGSILMVGGTAIKWSTYFNPWRLVNILGLSLYVRRFVCRLLTILVHGVVVDDASLAENVQPNLLSRHLVLGYFRVIGQNV